MLIVEDDQLVRKGLISILPWNDFHMRVVGEASNGKKALEFLEQTKVDLIFTDLNMPVMSGIEFMRIARQKYPDIFFAILTIHQDFEYVQEALRLGALDFITKVQLEKENFDEILKRIYQRILKESNHQVESEMSNFDVDTGIVVYRRRPFTNTEWLEDSRLKLISNLKKIDEQIILLVPKQNASLEEIWQELDSTDDFLLVEIHNIRNQFKNQVHRLLIDYKDNLFFYDSHKETNRQVKTVADFEGENDIFHQHTYKLRKKLLELDWIIDQQQFEETLQELQHRRLPRHHLYQLLIEFADEWNMRYSYIPASRRDHPEPFDHWHEVEKWLNNFREIALLSIGKNYANDVVKSILNAVKLIQENVSEPITAEDIAMKVSMSRSYFNKCFKDITGQSFHQYLKERRLNKAKEMLKNSNESIQWISEQTGYLDEKYFSKIFKQQIGMLPSEYRKPARREKNDFQ
ncbi:response regulator [Halobacillus seohaensis]|uniref:Response regulator n=1 Tax=Halobacillus seohaensis TaxID=447421 RepID=A0ABW2EMK6_9BACI